MFYRKNNSRDLKKKLPETQRSSLIEMEDLGLDL